MKEIKFTIRLYGWKDFTKWLWDKLVYPRREQVTFWLEMYKQDIIDDIDKIYYEHEHIDLANIDEHQHYLEFFNKMRKAVEDRTKNTIEIILTVK